MKVTFVGHAGMIVQHEEISILIDPWLKGSVFNDGWDLLVPSVLRETDIRHLTHIWISHEHPDHFHPESLRWIRSVADQDITVLFQNTADSRVITWCHDAGFEVCPVVDENWMPLNDEFKITVGKVGLYDSWAAFAAGGSVFLNLNDCVFPEPKNVDTIGELVGQIDCLMAQFSYASWMGNPEETEFREREAERRGGKLIESIHQLCPAAVIPAASFIWFSHQENSYLNDLRVDLKRVVEQIESSGSTAIVMTPGEEWEIGTDHESAKGVAFYTNAWDVSDRELHTSDSVGFDVLLVAASTFTKRLKERNNRVLLHLLRLPPIKLIAPLRMYLTDLNETVEFHPLGGLTRVRLGKSIGESIVSLHSSSLLYALEFDWGSDTLRVNGRFRADLDGPWQLNRAFLFAVLNNAGRYVRFRELLDRRFLKKAVRRIRIAMEVTKGSTEAPL